MNIYSQLSIISNPLIISLLSLPLNLPFKCTRRLTMILNLLRFASRILLLTSLHPRRRKSLGMLHSKSYCLLKVVSGQRKPELIKTTAKIPPPELLNPKQCIYPGHGLNWLICHFLLVPPPVPQLVCNDSETAGGRQI